MSYKTDIKYKVTLLKKDDFIYKLHALVKIEFSKALNDSKVTGQSIQSITYEFLEALEEVFDSQKDETLEQLSSIMLDTLYTNANANIQKASDLLGRVEENFYEHIELEKFQLLELIETFKSYATERDLHTFSKNLYKKEHFVELWSKNIDKKIQRRKGGDTT